MQKYILGRIAQTLVTLLALVTIVFFVVRLTGDPLDVILSEGATSQERAALAEKLGLDRPVYAQYGVFLAHAVKGDFGESVRFRRPSLEIFLERLPATLELGIVAILISIATAVPIGIYAAVWRGKPLDAIARTAAVVGQSMPPFWLGLLLMLVFAVWLGWLPSSGRGGLQHLILPSLTMGLTAAAGIMRLTRSSMLEVLGSEYVKLARAKGLSEVSVIWRHALINAALPILTFSAIVFALMLTGVVVTETVFGWPGVGRLVIDAVRWRDFPVVQTVVIFLGSTVIMMNLLVDVLYAYINPKIRNQR